MLNKKGDVEAIAYYLANENDVHTLSSNYVWPIDKENDSTYWVGTLGSGLNRITIGKRVTGKAVYSAERFGVNEGAPSNDIESVQVDQFGKVWCGGRLITKLKSLRPILKKMVCKDIYLQLELLAKQNVECFSLVE